MRNHNVIPKTRLYCVILLLVENSLANQFVPPRKQICTRYVNFLSKLSISSSKEVRHLAKIVSRDAKSTVFRNIQYIKNLSGLSPWDHTANQIVQKIENSRIPANNEWRMTMLLKLLNTRRKMSAVLEDTSHISLMIDSL